jgi:hypothetical protein
VRASQTMGAGWAPATDAPADCAADNV